jgi:hypothetical protein
MAEIVTGPNPAFVAQQQQNQPDLVGNFARLQQLKSLIQEAPLRQQALQQQVQEGQLNIQKEQLALQDQQKMGKVMQDGEHLRQVARPALTLRLKNPLQTTIACSI